MKVGDTVKVGRFIGEIETIINDTVIVASETEKIKTVKANIEPYIPEPRFTAEDILISSERVLTSANMNKYFVEPLSGQEYAHYKEIIDLVIQDVLKDLHSDSL